MSSEQMQQTVSNYFAAIRAMDKEAFLAVFAADGVSHDPVGFPPFEGSTGLSKFFSNMEKTFTKLDMVEEALFVGGNETAVKWQATGHAKNGKIATFAGINIFTINNEGNIQTLRAYWDVHAMMAQLKG